MYLYYSGPGANTTESRYATNTLVLQQPRPQLVYRIPTHDHNPNCRFRSNNDNSNSSKDGFRKVAEPSRATPAPPRPPTQSPAYSVSAGVAMLPTRAAPAPPAKPPPPPPKPPKLGANGKPSTQLLDPRRLRPVASARTDANRPPVPKKPTFS